MLISLKFSTTSQVVNGNGYRKMENGYKRRHSDQNIANYEQVQKQETEVGNQCAEFTSTSYVACQVVPWTISSQPSNRALYGLENRQVM